MDNTNLTPVMFTIVLVFIGFMWNRLDKRFDRLENKIDTLFEKHAESNTKIAVLESKAK